MWYYGLLAGILIVVIIFLVAYNYLKQNTLGSAGASCASSLNCQVPLICINNVCTAENPVNNGNIGQICSSQMCVAGNDCGTTVTSAYCSGTNTCACGTGTQNGQPCLSNANCLFGSFCNGDKQCGPNSDNTPNNCRFDSNCSVGTLCAFNRICTVGTPMLVPDGQKFQLTDYMDSSGIVFASDFILTNLQNFAGITFVYDSTTATLSISDTGAPVYVTTGGRIFNTAANYPILNRQLYVWLATDSTGRQIAYITDSYGNSTQESTVTSFGAPIVFIDQEHYQNGSLAPNYSYTPYSIMFI